MNEEFILDMLTIHGGLFRKFGHENDEQAFSNWMNKLKQFKDFGTIEETCEYFIEIWIQKDTKVA